MNRGFSLIEMLMSLILLTLMLLGMDAIFIVSLKKNRESYYLAVATQALQTMTERLQILNNSDLNDAIDQWQQEVKEVLPNGRCELREQYPSFELSVSWGKKSETECRHNKTGLDGCLKREITISD